MADQHDDLRPRLGTASQVVVDRFDVGHVQVASLGHGHPANAFTDANARQIGGQPQVAVENEQVAAQQVDPRPVEARALLVYPLNRALHHQIGWRVNHLEKLFNDLVSVQHVQPVVL